MILYHLELGAMAFRETRPGELEAGSITWDRPKGAAEASRWHPDAM